MMGEQAMDLQNTTKILNKRVQELEAQKCRSLLAPSKLRSANCDSREETDEAQELEKSADLGRSSFIGNSITQKT